MLAEVVAPGELTTSRSEVVGLEVPGSQADLAKLNELLQPAEQLNRVDVIDWEQFPIGVTGKTLKRVFRDRCA